MAAIPSSLLRLFGALSPLLNDPRLRRLVAWGAAEVEVLQVGDEVRRVAVALNEADLLASLEAMALKAGKPFDAEHPSVEAMLRDGTRFMALRPPVSRVPVLIVTRPGGRAESTVVAPILAERMAAGANLLWVEAGQPQSWRQMPITVAGPRSVYVGPPGEAAPPASMWLTPHRGARSVSVDELLLAGARMGANQIWVAEPRVTTAWDVLLHLSGRRAPMVVHVSGRTLSGALSRFEGLARSGAGPQRADGVMALLASGIDLVVLVRDGVVVTLAEIAWVEGRPQPTQLPLPTEPQPLRPGRDPFEPEPEAERAPAAQDLYPDHTDETDGSFGQALETAAGSSVDIELDLSMVGGAAPPPSPGDDVLHALLASLGAEAEDPEEIPAGTLISEAEKPKPSVEREALSRIMQSIESGEGWSERVRDRSTVVHTEQE